MKLWGLIFFFTGELCLAQTDTLWLKEATIKAHRRRPEMLLQSPDSIISLLLNHRSVAESFERENQLYNRKYGIGGIQTPGLRGLSAQQTVVLWNGVPVTNAMLGLADLSLIPSFVVGEATLEAGPSSSVHGTGAMGGTLHLNQNIPSDPELKLVGTINSLQNAHVGASASFRKMKYWSKTSTFLSRENNQFNYKNRYRMGQPFESTNHARTELFSVMHESGFKTGSKSMLNVRLWGNYADREIAPTMLQARSAASLLDQSLRTMAEHIWFDKNWRLTSRLSFSSESNSFLDPLASLHQTNAVQQWFVSSEGEKTMGHHQISTSLRAFQALGKSAHYTTTHRQQYVQIGGGHAYQMGKWNQQTTFQWMYVNERLHPFAFSSFTQFSASKILTVFLNAASGFRIPTLNEMYWNPGGNPTLKAEQSKHLSLGYQLSHTNVKLKQQAYYTPTRNLVRWIPEGATVTPENISGEVQLFGVESELSYQLTRRKHVWRVRGLHHLNAAHERIQEGVKQLDYVPYSRTYLELRYQYKAWLVMLSHQYTSARAVQGDILPHFNVWFFDCGYTFKQSTLLFNIQNIFNTQYELVALRPMPGTHFQLKYMTNIHFKHNNT